MSRIVNVQALMEATVERTVADLAEQEPDDLLVAHNVFPCIGLDYHEPDEEREVPGHYVESPEWRVTLYVTIGDEPGVHISGRLPYLYCSDGDPEPMISLVRSLWEDWSFKRLMASGGLDASLNKIAETRES